MTEMQTHAATPSTSSSKLRAILDSRGIKQRWLAAQVGVTDVRMSYWCQGKRPIEPEYVPALAKALKVRQKDLRDG